MGDSNKGRKIHATYIEGKTPSLTGKVKWIRLKAESNLVFSTKHNGKQRVIYYSQNSFTSGETSRRDYLLIEE
ncbi:MULTISPECIES: hypothetical protein [unclassified Rossellomorea]|uniref:hypothetical protein n=1 Tax=unclassified Rossellomorea TaxID=2837526 RepID=UPI00261039EF|nr:hypothetical protein [uncultured Rossellomorea sp.]